MAKEAKIYFRNKDPLVVGSKVFASSNAWDLTEEDLEKARVELGETEEKKRECIQELKDKLSKEGDYRTDDAFLLRFLRVRKFDCNKAYENVKNFYRMRNKHLEFYDAPSKMRSFKNFEFVTILPYADAEGRLMFWMDVGKWDPQNMSFEEFILPVLAVSDMSIALPKIQVNGFIGIWNLRGVGLRHVAELMHKNRLMALFSLMNFSYPWRIKKILVVNTSRITRFLYNIACTVASKKLTERIFLLSDDMGELHQHVDPAVLPKALGGSLDDDFCRRPEFILDNIPYLEYDRSFSGESVS